MFSTATAAPAVEGKVIERMENPFSRLPQKIQTNKFLIATYDNFRAFHFIPAISRALTGLVCWNWADDDGDEASKLRANGATPAIKHHESSAQTSAEALASHRKRPALTVALSLIKFMALLIIGWQSIFLRQVFFLYYTLCAISEPDFGKRFAVKWHKAPNATLMLSSLKWSERPSNKYTTYANDSKGWAIMPPKTSALKNPGHQIKSNYLCIICA